MMAHEIINSLEHIGYTLTVVDGKIRGDRQDLLPPPPEAPALLDQLRQHKGEVLDLLLYRGFTVVPPSSGDFQQTLVFEGEAAMQRWGTAYRSGLIHLTDKVQVDRRSGRCKVSFRCAMPMDWLEDAITAQCKREYNKLLMRISKGEVWLREHSEDHPEYQKAYDGYLALYETLRNCMWR